MTKEETLKIWLPVIKWAVKDIPECNEAFDMATKAFEQEPCEDCISRKEVHRQINKWVASGESENDLGSLHNRIRALPPVIPQQKVGRWINGNSICPCCGEDKFKDLDADIWSDWKPKYCPNCGAKMAESEE